jgi:hypothetical protein
LVTLRSRRTPRTRKKQAWTSDEARTFLESAAADGDPYHALYVLVLVLALRKGEVLGLSWDEIDLDAEELAVEWQVQRVEDSGFDLFDADPPDMATGYLHEDDVPYAAWRSNVYSAPVDASEPDRCRGRRRNRSVADLAAGGAPAASSNGAPSVLSSPMVASQKGREDSTQGDIVAGMSTTDRLLLPGPR